MLVDLKITEIISTPQKKANGETEDYYYFSYYKPSGERMRVYSRSRVKIEKKHKKIAADLMRGKVEPSNVTWDKFADQFLEYRRDAIGLKIRRRSWENDERHLRLHLNPYFGEKRLVDIKVVDVNMLLIKMSVGKLSPKTQRHVLNTGLRLMRHAIACEVASFNPFDADPSNGRETVNGANGTRGGYSSEEVEGILNAETNLMYKAIWFMASFTGLSASELVGLQWRDLDLGKGQVEINRSAVRYEYNDDAKTVYRKRTLAIPPRTLRWLKEWKIACANEVIVFPSAVDGLASQDTWRKQLKKTCKAADVQYKAIGGFRNFFCTSMENSGVPNAIRNYRLGHSKKSNVADVHYTDVDLKKATSAADAVKLEASISP